MKYIIQFAVGVTIIIIALGLLRPIHIAAVFVGAFMIGWALKKWIVDHTDVNKITLEYEPEELVCVMCGGVGWKASIGENNEAQTDTCLSCGGSGKVRL